MRRAFILVLALAVVSVTTSASFPDGVEVLPFFRSCDTLAREDKPAPDPYAFLNTPFYTATQEGNRLFALGLYEEADDHYRVAMQCPEFSMTENHLEYYRERCALAILYRNEMLRFESEGEYAKACKYAVMLMDLNPQCTAYADKVSRLKMNAGAVVSRTAVASDADVVPGAGEDRKPFTKTHSLFYQWSADRPFGVMTARLKPAGIGWYFDLGMNKGCLDVLSRFGRTYETVPEKPSFEFGAGAGITIAVVPKYIWVLASPLAYIGGGYSQPYSSLAEYWNNIKYFNVYAPEAGAALRLWRFVLSYKFQYKYVFSEEQNEKDMFGTQSHIFGIGYCW